MSKTYQAFSFALTAALCIAFMSAAIGCATTANDYDVKAHYERMARRNFASGGRALCSVNGQAISPEDITFWTRVVENWPSYLKALGLDAATVALAWYIYEQRDNGGGEVAGDTYITNNYPAEPAEDTGGAAE